MNTGGVKFLKVPGTDTQPMADIAMLCWIALVFILVMIFSSHCKLILLHTMYLLKNGHNIMWNEEMTVFCVSWNSIYFEYTVCSRWGRGRGKGPWPSLIYSYPCKLWVVFRFCFPASVSPFYYQIVSCNFYLKSDAPPRLFGILDLRKSKCFW